MAEKVIFEYRSTQDEDCCAFELGHNFDCTPAFGPVMVYCHADPGHGKRRVARSKRARRRQDDARRDMREGLDFLERMYDDLFGDEGSGESRDPSSDLAA